MKDYPRKVYFRDRTLAQKTDLDLDESVISNVLNGVPFGSLVLSIDNLKQNQGLIVPQIIPDEFYIKTNSTAGAGRKAFHHIKYVPMSQPSSKKGAIDSTETPLQIRERDFQKLRDFVGNTPEIGRENDLSYLGYSFRPVQGRDRDKRLIPFVWLADAGRIFSYASQMTQGIDVEEYAKSERVRIEGASVVLGVPSRRQKQPRYKFKLEHVPMVRRSENLATVLSLRPATAFSSDEKPLQGEMAHERYNIRYNYLGDQEGSQVKTFYPHHIAGYLGIIDKAWTEKKNLTPLEMCPFALPSSHMMEFDKRLRNNVVVYDRNVKSKNHLRNLYIAERSILLGRALSVFGNNDFLYCDLARDGHLRDYNSWKWEE